MCGTGGPLPKEQVSPEQGRESFPEKHPSFSQPERLRQSPSFCCRRCPGGSAGLHLLLTQIKCLYTPG